MSKGSSQVREGREAANIVKVMNTLVGEASPSKSSPQFDVTPVPKLCFSHIWAFVKSLSESVDGRESA